MQISLAPVSASARFVPVKHNQAPIESEGVSRSTMNQSQAYRAAQRAAARRARLNTDPSAIGYRAKLRWLAEIRKTIAPAIAAIETRDRLMRGIGSSVGYFEHASRNYGGAGAGREGADFTLAESAPTGARAEVEAGGRVPAMAGE